MQRLQPEFSWQCLVSQTLVVVKVYLVGNYAADILQRFKVIPVGAAIIRAGFHRIGTAGRAWP